MELLGTGMIVQIFMYNKNMLKSENRIKNNISKLKYMILDNLSIIHSNSDITTCCSGMSHSNFDYKKAVTTETNLTSSH
jgi:hypothetical protein